MGYKGGKQVPRSVARDINAEKKAVKNMGKNLLQAVDEAQEAIEKLSERLRKAAKEDHGEAIEQKVRELGKKNRNIMMNLGQMKWIAGSIAGKEKAEREA